MVLAACNLLTVSKRAAISSRPLRPSLVGSRSYVMCRAMLYCVVNVVACLLFGVRGQAQEQSLPLISPPQQDIKSAAGSSVYVLPANSRPQQTLETRLPPQPPLRQPAESYRDQSPIEPTQFAKPLDQQPSGDTAAATPETTYTQPANLNTKPQTHASTSAKTPEPSREENTQEHIAAGNDTSITVTGLAGLKELIPTSLPDAWDKLVNVWRYEIFMKVTVETLSIALVLLLIGYLASKRISSWFASRILGRLGIGQNNVATIQTVGFYALMAAF